MELIGLYRNKDNNKTKPFGHKVCGLRCDNITLNPEEILDYLKHIRHTLPKEEAFDRLVHYLITLNLCLRPKSNDRNTELPSND